MKSSIQRTKNNIKNIFEDKNKLLILCICLGLFAVFMFVLAYLTPAEGLKNQRCFIGEGSAVLGFYLIPFLDMKKKDNLMRELMRFFINMLIVLITIAYWIWTIDKHNANIIFDIFFSLLFLYTSYYFVTKLFNILIIFSRLISGITNKIFNKPESKGARLVFEHFIALLITLSGAFTAVLTIATSVKAIVDIFK